jgi:ferric-dicitrate binding protein FerR (iron transport regulator)
MKLYTIRRCAVQSRARLPAILRRTPVAAMVGVILVCGLTFAAGTGAHPVGSIAGWGDYAVDRMPSPPGMLVFPGDVVTTESNSGAEIRFPSGSVIRLDGGTELALAADGVELRHGSLSMRGLVNESRRIRVLGASVTVDGAGTPSLCRLQSADGAALIAVAQGVVTVRGAGAPAVLTAGHAARLSRAEQQAGQQSAQNPTSAPATAAPSGTQSAAPPAAGPPAATQPASSAAASALIQGPVTIGRTVGVYPDALVRHPGTEIATPLRLDELMDAGDTVGTLDEGRARVQLFDNTIVDAGVATTFKLVSHDPNAHTSELQLSAGHLRVVVPPLEESARGAEPRFVVRSERAEVTAGPTTFFVSIGPRETTVCNVASGLVTVRNPAVTAAAAPAKVAPGECSVTLPGEAPGASHPDTVRMERVMVLADFETGPGLPATGHRRAVAETRTAVYSGAAALTLVSLLQVPSIPRNFNPELNYSSFISSYLGGLNNTVLSSESAIEVEHQLCLAFIQFEIELGVTVSPSVPPQECPNVP